MAPEIAALLRAGMRRGCEGDLRRLVLVPLCVSRHSACSSAPFSCLSGLPQVAGFVPVTAAGSDGNYVKMCKSTSRFICLNISLNKGVTPVQR